MPKEMFKHQNLLKMAENMDLDNKKHAMKLKEMVHNNLEFLNKLKEMLNNYTEKLAEEEVVSKKMIK
jgi:hypothetical protein